jgi:hypothetical protein
MSRPTDGSRARVTPSRSLEVPYVRLSRIDPPSRRRRGGPARSTGSRNIDGSRWLWIPTIRPPWPTRRWSPDARSLVGDG